MPKIRKEEIIKAVERHKRGETSQKAEAKKQGVSHQTFQDWIRRYETFGSDGFGNTGNRKFRKHKLAMVSTFVLLIFYLTAIFGNFVAPQGTEQYVHICLSPMPGVWCAIFPTGSWSCTWAGWWSSVKPMNCLPIRFTPIRRRCCPRYPSPTRTRRLIG